MTDNIRVQLDASGLSGGLETAGAEIDRIARNEIAPAAALIEDAFADAAATIETRLARAAQRGTLSLKGLGRALRRDLVDSLVRRPLESALTNLFTAPFGGARAAGGPVAPGARYLVGERGPEVFTPGRSGTVSPASGGVTVNFSVSGVSDADSFRRSESQLTAALARAVARGQRGL